MTDEEDDEWKKLTPTQKEEIELLDFSEEGKERREIVKELKRPRSTIYDNLVKLEKKGFVKRYKQHNGKVGRPIKVWKLTEEGKEFMFLYGEKETLFIECEECGITESLSPDEQRWHTQIFEWIKNIKNGALYRCPNCKNLIEIPKAKQNKKQTNK